MMGRLVRDPQINYVENGKGDEMAVANFRLAVDRKFSDDTDYFPCAAFGRLALPLEELPLLPEEPLLFPESRFLPPLSSSSSRPAFLLSANSISLK